MRRKIKKTHQTFASIARECGVSVMTVSRALRDRTSVKESTRNRILQVAERKGYHPSGRLGRPRRTGEDVRPSVVVLMESFKKTPLFYSELLISIEQELFKYGHDCMVRTCTGEYAHFLSLCESLRQSPAVGTLLLGYFPIDHLRILPTIVPHPMLVDNPGDPRLEYPYDAIGFDNAEAARLAVRHLVRTGRKRIVLIKGFSGHFFSIEIEQGYREVLRQEGIGVNEELILEADFTAEEAHRVIAEAMEKGLGFDAVFTNDEMACGVMRALHERRISIPSEIAVAGCDGLPIGLQMVPRLTTVMLDYKRLGRVAVEYLLDRRRKESAPCRIKLVPVLEVRESTVVQ